MGNMATKAKMLTTKEAAEQLGTDPKSLRVFLRTATGKTLVDQGEQGRYAIPASNIAKIRKLMADNAKAAAARKAEREAQEAAEPDLEPEDDDEPEEVEELIEDEEAIEDDEEEGDE
jgi:hypothetical protein